MKSVVKFSSIERLEYITMFDNHNDAFLYSEFIKVACLALSWCEYEDIGDNALKERIKFIKEFLYLKGDSYV